MSGRVAFVMLKRLHGSLVECTWIRLSSDFLIGCVFLMHAGSRYANSLCTSECPSTCMPLRGERRVLLVFPMCEISRTGPRGGIWICMRYVPLFRRVVTTPLLLLLLLLLLDLFSDDVRYPSEVTEIFSLTAHFCCLRARWKGAVMAPLAAGTGSWATVLSCPGFLPLLQLDARGRPRLECERSEQQF